MKKSVQKCTQRSSDLWPRFTHPQKKMRLIVDTLVLMCRFFWACVQFPLGVLREPPELPCCQEVWVPAETPLHLPGALQVDHSDILFSHRQITADRERNVWTCSTVSHYEAILYNCRLILPPPCIFPYIATTPNGVFTPAGDTDIDIFVK